MDKSFLKTEPVAAPGPALVAGGVDEAPIGGPIGAPSGATVTLTGDVARKISDAHAVGDEFDGDGMFRVVSIDGDNVELEVVDLTPTGGGGGAETAEGAIDEYLAGKKAPPEEEELE